MKDQEQPKDMTKSKFEQRGRYLRARVIFIMIPFIFCSIMALASEFTPQKRENVSDKAFPVINMINDVSHHYSFFYAWRNQANFAGKYGYVDGEHGQQMTQNQATISSLDLSNYNLFNLYMDTKYDEPYLKEDLSRLKKFVARDGGGLFVVLAGAGEKNGDNANDLLKEFGVKLSDKKIQGAVKLQDNEIISGIEKLDDIKGGRQLILENKAEWEVLATDAEDAPLLVVRKFGKGHLALSGFTPFIKKKVKGKKLPGDYKFPNYEYAQQLFKHLSSGKILDRGITIPVKFSPEKIVELKTMKIRCTAYSQKYAQNVIRDYEIIYPLMEKYMGVPLANVDQKNKLTIHLLPVQGSGWSSGSEIAIAMYKSTYFGILGHELTHSWVLPHAEPLSNEGIAIWVGNRIRQELGEIEAGTEQISRRVDGALKDPLFKSWDPITLRGDKEENLYSKILKFGKYMYVLQTFEEKYGKDILAKYFQLKRKVVPAKEYSFNCHDSAWLWTKVTGEDQFCFLNSIGISVDKGSVTIPKV